MVTIKLRLFCLFLLPLLACAVINTRTPTPVSMPASPTLPPLSLTKASIRTSAILTRVARKTLHAPTATRTRTPGASRTPMSALSSKSTATPSPTFSATAQFPQVEAVTIPAPALNGNLLGELATRELLVYLPASYGQPEKRYPVVYYLLNFGLLGRDVTINPADIQKDVAFGIAKEQILVIISGINSLGGSFYVNSPVTGNWDDFIARDVVSYVDANYRTLPQPASRGITGYAMGGFGAISVSMRHPDIFGVVYSISPTLFDADGLPLSPMFSSPRIINSVLDLQVREQSMLVSDGVMDMQHAGDAQFSMAYGAAFAPNTHKLPYLDYPYYRQNGRIFRDEAIWQRWQAGLGGIPDKVQQYKENLLKLSNITLVCSKNAPYIWIQPGCQAFSTQLGAVGVPNQLIRFPGELEPGIEQSIRGFILPFFSEKLLFQQ